MLAPFEINHSDDELAFLCYYPFLLYEQDPTYRRMWLMSLERSWQIERPERSPLFNFIYGAITGKPCDVENAVRTLQEWPLDLRNWECRNSHRLDITLDTRKGRFGEWQSVEVLPYSERPVMRWNGNPHRLDGETRWAEKKTMARRSCSPTGWGFITGLFRRSRGNTLCPNISGYCC